MMTSASTLRLAVYFKRNGFWATIRRAGLALKRALLSNRKVIFYYDMSEQSSLSADLPSSLSVERKRNEAEVNPEELQEITGFWNPRLARRNIEQRFGLGASLWLIRSEDRLAGYGWTLQGRTVERHYFPLGEHDVQFFDFQVFPKYRGRAIDWFLINHIFSRLVADGGRRAFGEAAEWNQASLSSFAMSPFRLLGCARKLTIFGCTIVWWHRNNILEPKRKAEFKKASVAAKNREESRQEVNDRRTSMETNSGRYR